MLPTATRLNSARGTTAMHTGTQPHPIHRHLGEREFLDYPVGVDAERAERHEVLARTLVATLAIVACVAAASLLLR